MTAPHIHGRFRTIPASLMLDTLGNSLSRVKSEDGATDGDLGAVLGKSDDRAAAYRAGAGDMGVVSFLRGCAAWDGRFANDALALIGMRLTPIEPEAGCDRAGQTAVCRLSAQLSVALEDGHIDDRELAQLMPYLDAVALHIDRLRSRRGSLMLAGGTAA